MTELWMVGSGRKFANYVRAVERTGGRVRVHGTPRQCAGLLLPGGGDMEPWRYGQDNLASRNLDPERDALELDLIRLFVSLGKPVLGICRGMQSINVSFGGTLLQDIPGHSQLDGVDRLHPVRTAPGFFSALNVESVNSAHHQAVDRLGDGLSAQQWAPDGVIEALRHESLPVFGVQWHPERLPDPAGDALFQMFLDLCAAVSPSRAP